MDSGNSTDKIGGGQILLIGNASAALSGMHTLDKLPIKVCAGMLDGIEAAVKTPFAVIAVVMADAATNLRGGLATLRKSTSAKIVLLARMYEEPRAMELVGTGGSTLSTTLKTGSLTTGNGTGLADDYVICPIQMGKFCEAIHHRPGAVEDTTTAIADTAVRAKMNRLEKLATEDDLTGLKNRRYIREFAKQIIERAGRDNGRMTVLIFDIDNFKHYNDVYGHAAGDEVLKQAALLIRRCCRRHDMVGRIGGDEFAVVFWDDPRCGPPTAGGERRAFTADHPKEVISIAKRFRRELGRTEFRLLGPEGRGVLTISGGLASLGADGSTAEELFAKADHALFDAKRSGKNRVYLVGQPENDIDKIG
jgi:GGDEF domain-containing protein